MYHWGKKTRGWRRECLVCLVLQATACRNGTSNRLSPLLLSPVAGTAGISHYTWLLFPLLRAGCRRGNNQDKTQVKRLLSGSYSWHISSKEISGNSCQEQVWAGVEGLSQVSAEKHELVHRHQKKKIYCCSFDLKTTSGRDLGGHSFIGVGHISR